MVAFVVAPDAPSCCYSVNDDDDDENDEDNEDDDSGGGRTHLFIGLLCPSISIVR